MKFKEIVLGGTLLLSSSLALSQNELHFDIYSREDGILNFLRSSSLKASPNEVDFSFLFGIYSMKAINSTDSTYQEIVKNNIPWETKDEFFNYSKDSCYVLNSYFTKNGKSREEKEALEGRIFDKKYKTLPELFNDFEKGLLGDSLHFIVQGMPYSARIKKIDNSDRIIYSCTFDVKRESGDMYICPYPIEVYTIKKDGKLTPTKFSTMLLNSKNGKKIPLQGKLREKR